MGLPFWSSSILVVFHFGGLPFWSPSILVVFHFGRLPFWSSSILVVFHFGRLPFWSSSIFCLSPVVISHSSLLYTCTRPISKTGSCVTEHCTISSCLKGERRGFLV